MYQRSEHSLSDAQKDLLRRLRSDGIAITTVEDLMGDRSLFEELGNAVRTRQAQIKSMLNKVRKQVDEPGFKTYLFELLDTRPVLDAKSVFVRFSLQPAVLSLINGYFSFYTRLRCFNVWQNFPSKSAPRNS